jgi:DNA-directed RNA polymerase subunit beta
MPATTKYIEKITAAPTDELVSFDDFDRRRAMVFDSAREATKQRFPLSNERYSLELEDVDYDDLDKPFTLREQKDAILGGRTLAKQLKGRFVLKDVNTGQVIEKGGRRVVANVPYLTQRGTFIRNGNESVMLNQMRMVPGAYSRITNDNKFETLVNVKQGTGTQFKLQFDPETAQFNFKAGGRKVPAYPVLKAMGVTDDQLKANWGEDILNKNRVVNEKRAINSAYEVFIPKHLKDKIEEVKDEQST